MTKGRGGSGGRKPERRKRIEMLTRRIVARRQGLNPVSKGVDLVTLAWHLLSSQPSCLKTMITRTKRNMYINASVKLKEDNKHAEFMRAFKMLFTQFHPS